MMRDWAGLDSSSEDGPELVSAGPGEGGSGSTSLAAVLMGSEESLRRCESVVRALPLLLPPRLRAVYPEAVFEDGFRMGCGRGVVLRGVPGVLPSARGSGESLRMERTDGARCRPAAEPARGIPSPGAPPSGPGTGEGADEPLAAAAAFRSWART